MTFVCFALLTSSLAAATIPRADDDLVLNGAMERIAGRPPGWRYQCCVVDEEACQALADERGRRDANATPDARCENEDTPLACFIK